MRNEALELPRVILAPRWSHDLNARLTKNVMALPQTVGFKAEAVDEEGVWCCVHCWRSKRWLRDRFLWRLECWEESQRLWSKRDQGSNTAWSEKKSKKRFPLVNNVFALRRPTFTFKYHPNLCEQKLKLRFASILGVNLHNISWTKYLWISKTTSALSLST